MKTLIKMKKTQNIQDAEKDAKTTIKRQTEKVVETKSIKAQTDEIEAGTQTDSQDKNNQLELMLKYVASSLHCLIKNTTKLTSRRY